MKYLVLALRKSGFDPARIPAHNHFLADLRAQGALEQAGPFTDASGGAYVLRAADLDEALSLAQRDPLHVHGCSTISVREWDGR